MKIIYFLYLILLIEGVVAPPPPVNCPPMIPYECYNHPQQCILTFQCFDNPPIYGCSQLTLLPCLNKKGCVYKYKCSPKKNCAVLSLAECQDPENAEQCDSSSGTCQQK